MPPPELLFSLYLITRPILKKAKNIRENPNVSFVVPFPHYFFHLIPPSCIQFQGKAEILPSNDPLALKIFQSNRVLKSSLEHTRILGEPIFFRIIPHEKIFCWGINASLWQIIKHKVDNNYLIIPPDRRKG